MMILSVANEILVGSHSLLSCFSTGWYRASDGVEERDNALILSRLCALQWLVVLYEYVVPNSLKAEVRLV